jgi:hypothetical protein
MYRHSRCRVAAGALSAMLLALPAQAAVLTFSEVTINSYAAISDTTPDLLRDATGAAVELDAAGSRNLAYGNGSGGFVAKAVSDDVFARSSLQAAELKASSMLGFGTDVASNGVMPVGHTNGSASATAMFGDSFRTFADNQPFLWSDGDTATFNFAITGSTSIDAGIAAPDGNPFLNPGEIKNFVYGSLQLLVYASGTIDLIVQLRDFDFGTGDIADYLALNQQINDSLLLNEFWYVGDNVLPADFGLEPEDVLSLNGETPTEVSVQFDPNGDFDWILTLDTLVQLDASQQNVQATMNFANTVVASYVGPDGTETRSGSGLFPGTSALVAEVSEPSSLALLTLLLPVGWRLRRRRA